MRGAYRFFADGGWRDDPADQQQVGNSIGTANCVRIACSDNRAPGGAIVWVRGANTQQSERYTVTRTTAKVSVLIAGLSALPLLVGLAGCASAHYGRSTDQLIEDSRTAERVREALAASADYRYDGVRVIASDGAVHLSGYVNTSAHRTHAGEVANQVVSVKSVENNLTVKD